MKEINISTKKYDDTKLIISAIDLAKLIDAFKTKKWSEKLIIKINEVTE